jgi:hypothetical protein
MNSFLIVLGSIGPLLFVVFLIWGIIGPDRNKKEYVNDIYGDIYPVSRGSASFQPLIFVAILTYFGIRSAVQGNAFGQLFILASIVLSSLCFLWLAYLFAKYRLNKRFVKKTSVNYGERARGAKKLKKRESDRPTRHRRRPRTSAAKFIVVYCF